ncbi:MAG: mycofactocin biosynthesis glycosyltransferase MftF [Ilumatobacteraceae bacterium]
MQDLVKGPRRFTIDQSWWRYRSRRGDIVTAGSPMRLFRFAPTAGSLLERLEAGEVFDGPSSGEEHLLERLLGAEAIHERFSSSKISLDDVTIVIPARDPIDIDDLVRALPPVHRIIVVDDGSSPPIHAVSGAQVHRLPTSIGPAGARNAGSAMTTSSVVVFIDADVEIPGAAQQSSFWEPLLGHFSDPQVGLVAPRVTSTPGTSALARYEATDSPLDMGPHPARVRLGGHLSYVPSAVMAVRTTDLRRIGGFDSSMRYGEDVDLVWRFDAAGIRCRYEPTVVLHHRPRPTWVEAGRQRFHYGTSAARLEQGHPGALAPVRLPAWTAGAWATALGGHVLLATLATAVPVWRLRDALRSRVPVEDAVVITRLFVHGHLLAGRAVAQAITRTWWPVMAVASPFSRRVRWIWMLAVVVPGLWRWKSRHSSLDVLRYLAARFYDDLSYGSGVWDGIMRTRRLGVLRPALTFSWKRPAGAGADRCPDTPRRPIRE